MSWARIYRVALRLLPYALRHKHGAAMAALFARDLEAARAEGRLSVVRAGVAGVADALRRGVYEHVRATRRPTAISSQQHARVGTLLGADDVPVPVAVHQGAHVSIPTTRELLRRHAVAFFWAFIILTVPLVAQFAMRQAAALSARGAPTSALLEALLLALPFTAAMTVPMAVLFAVLVEFARLGANGTLAAARQTRDGAQRLVVPVVGAAVGVSLLALVLTAFVVPRTNAQLVELVSTRGVAKSDRTMTMGELRSAERTWRAAPDAASQRQAAAYEVEFQKKLALPAACLALALVGIALALRFPRGGMWMAILASVAILGLYYAIIMAGEALAERLVVSPILAMWGANVVLVIMAWLASLGRIPTQRVNTRGSIAIGG